MMALLSSSTTAVTTEMLEPIVDGITANIAVIMPVGITIFGVMIGLRLVPRIIRFFTN